MYDTFSFGKNVKETKIKRSNGLQEGEMIQPGSDALAAQFNTPVIIETLRQTFISFSVNSFFFFNIPKR